MIKFTTPLLSLPIDDNILALLHTALLPKLKVMKTFPIVIWHNLIELGGLGLYFLEIESLLQVVNLSESLYIANTPIQSLLRVIIECMHLKIGVITPFFTLLHEDFEELIMPL